MVRAGGPSTGGLVAATDNLVIGIGGLVVENNFEPGDGHVAVTSANDTSLGFGFGQETATGSGAYVSGPNGADGSGSVALTVNATGGELYGTGVFSATALDSFRFLSYKTYQKNPGTNAATLQMDADYDSTDGSTAFQGRLVFEPSMSGQQTVTNETWQTWNPLTAPSGWWQTGNAVVNGGNVGKACTQASPCSFAQVLAAYPDASVRPVTGQNGGEPIGGGVYFKAGSRLGRRHVQRRLADRGRRPRRSERHRHLRLRGLTPSEPRTTARACAVFAGLGRITLGAREGVARPRRVPTRPGHPGHRERHLTLT